MTKQSVLTESDLQLYPVNLWIRGALDKLVEQLKGVPRSEINVLDWGCGRGGAVACLLADGFNAFGVDIDHEVMKMGFDLLESRGFCAQERLMHIERLPYVEAGFFHFICSNQVIEHISDLSIAFKEMARLTKIGGRGFHVFPASKRIEEPHLHMPFIHWLPKTKLRKVAIGAFIICGYGPWKFPWQDALTRPTKSTASVFLSKTDKFYRYLNDKTFYRDIVEVCHTAAEAGFSPSYKTTGGNVLTKYASAKLKRNGFPRGQIVLTLQKERA